MVTLTGEKVSVCKTSKQKKIKRFSGCLTLAAPPQVDIFLMTQPQSGRWVHFDTEVTNSSGRVAYTIPKSKKLGLGVYPVKMVVK